VSVLSCQRGCSGSQVELRYGRFYHRSGTDRLENSQLTSGNISAILGTGLTICDVLSSRIKRTRPDTSAMG
jgi:hypothetical protein